MRLGASRRCSSCGDRHRYLRELAKREGASINQIINAAVGTSNGRRPDSQQVVVPQSGFRDVAQENNGVEFADRFRHDFAPG